MPISDDAKWWSEFLYLMARACYLSTAFETDAAANVISVCLQQSTGG